MPITDYKSVDARDQNGKPVRGVCRREIGTFQARKGITQIEFTEYEYYLVFMVGAKRYRSVFGKESEHGKIGATGKWESKAVEHAVEALLRFKENAKRGHGPTSIKEEMELARLTAEEQRRKEKTVNEIAGEFLADIAIDKPNIKSNKPRTIKEYQQNLDRDVLPAIGKRRAQDVEREDIAEVIEKIVRRGKIVQANRTLSAVSRMFSWALSKGKVRYNPCSMMEKYEEKPRKRTLTEPEKREETTERPNHNEIKLLWQGLSAVGHQTEARILMLCLLLGSRPGEICQMRWKNIEEEKWWVLDQSEVKTDLTLEAYLTPTALGIIGKKQDKKHSYVFMMETDETRHLPEDRLSRYVRRNDYFGLPPWQPRDIRRTYTTLGKSLGFSDLILNMTQARVDRSVIREFYDQNRYYRDRRQLAEAIEREILRISGQAAETVTPA